VRKSILDVLMERSTSSLFLNAEGRIVKTKGDLHMLFNGAPDEAIGLSLSDLLEPVYRKAVADIVERCLDSGRSETVAIRFSAAMEIRQVLLVPRDLTAVNWPPEAVIQAQDVSGGLRSHDISLVSHELFTSILNDIGEGIIVFDPALKITHVNDFAAQLLGLERKKLLADGGSTLSVLYADLIPGDESAQILREGLEFNKITHVQTHEDKQLSLLLNFYPVKDGDGKVTHIIETLQDVTEEQKTALKIQHINRRLQEKVRELSVLNKLSSDFNVCTSGRELFPRVTSTIVCGLGFHDTVSVLSLRDPETVELKLRAFFGVEEDQAGSLTDKPQSLPDNVVISGEKAREIPALREQGLSNAIYAPIVIDGQHIGYLNVFHRSRDPMLKEEETLLRILTENLGHFIKRRRTEQELLKKVLTLSVLKQISDALQTARTLEQIAYIFLTGVTAEQGLGFNRAMLFLIDEEQDLIRGEFAVGPAAQEEAHRIWAELQREPIDFGQLLQDHSKIEALTNSELTRLIRNTSMPLDGKGLFTEVLKNQSALHVEMPDVFGKVEHEFLSSLGCEECAIVPLFATDRPIGILLVDNRFTREPINDEDLRFLELVAKQGQSALESYLLYTEVEKKLEMLKRSNQLLQEFRYRLADQEKLGALGQMAASVAHEIRNPLVTIGGFARALQEDCPPDNQNKKYLKIIADEVSRLETVVTNLLNYAKPLRPSYRHVSLREIVLETISIVEPEFADAGIAISTRLDRKTTKVWLDPDLIKQALLNIFSNSLDATESGGKMRVSTAIRSDHITMSVKDTGKGINEENIGKLFKPFFTTRPGGVGLGLAIVQQIVSSHGGRIKVKSRLGGGTAFHIVLPLIDSSEVLSKNFADKEKE